LPPVKFYNDDGFENYDGLEGKMTAKLISGAEIAAQIREEINRKSSSSR